MFDPPINAAANTFIIIAVTLISLGAATVVVDVYKNIVRKKKSTGSEKE